MALQKLLPKFLPKDHQHTLRMGPCNPTIKKGHLSNSVNSTMSPEKTTSCHSTLAFPWDTGLSSGSPTSLLGAFHKPKSGKQAASRAFIFILSANHLDGKLMFILGNTGKNIARTMMATLYGVVTAARYLALKDYLCRWMFPFLTGHRPPGKPEEESGLQHR